MQIPRPRAAEPDSGAQSWETIQTVQAVRWVVGTSSWRAPVGLERKMTKVPVGIRRGFTIHGPFLKGSASESPGGGSWAGSSPGNFRNCFLAGPAHLHIDNPWPRSIRTWEAQTETHYLEQGSGCQRLWPRAACILPAPSLVFLSSWCGACCSPLLHTRSHDLSCRCLGASDTTTPDSIFSHSCPLWWGNGGSREFQGSLMIRTTYGGAVRVGCDVRTHKHGWAALQSKQLPKTNTKITSRSKFFYPGFYINMHPAYCKRLATKDLTSLDMVSHMLTHIW